MMAEIISGKAIAEEIGRELLDRVRDLKRRGIIPGLGVVLVGDDPASKVYVRNKKRTGEKLGIEVTIEHLPAHVKPEEVVALINRWNENSEIDGMIIQLPLPPSFDKQKLLDLVDPMKDVDGFSSYNLGRLFSGEPQFIPATPQGILEILRRTRTRVRGRHCVIVGRSTIVGRPMAALLLMKRDDDFGDGTVTVCHSRTENLPQITRSADILIVAVGRPRFIKPEMVKPGAVVIDVGSNRVEDKWVGDVDEGVREVAAKITPVPGGVGPLTVIMLMKNTIQAAEWRLKRS
ncbi:bifunctional 5,10-methylene-tetrahydrofolate dehydrogenase/5,10-methylene-tetrahydrofolate cyclohydrolase [candidate division WOR-3 bacterium]|uniref:Bifunctional protein FolD n=1 Tax=candidate division WOR-3 bacterium TaxID=2052148 RepID=A0A660SG99_UNCW3|nr:MAG: bifunctional 5,10-methylene-tetrahydrofolate dehydrogenase/5,10-methylene-tetrahydrofolate cyclohydrolase [candidate division WOR-3 bacterium]